MKLLTLIIVILASAPALFASAIFAAPTGCTALAPAPNVTGVQCFGSFASDVTFLQANFAGSGSGPLWATSATLDYHFSTDSAFFRSVSIVASINGGAASTLLVGGVGPASHTGSLTIPLTYGATLNSWLINVAISSPFVGGHVIDIPTTGVGLRLLVNHNPPATSNVPEPATAATFALGLGAFLLWRHRRKLPLFLLLAPSLFANAIFTAPTGCTAIAPAPNVTGVQCFGSFTGGVTTVASFSGAGSGSLFATSALFEWDFTTEGMFPRIVNAFANVNGRAETRLDISFGFSQRHTGSVQIPVTFGEPLSLWQLIVDSSADSRIDIPTTGVGLRLLVNHSPPATAGLCGLAAAALLLKRAKRLALLPLLAMAPLAAAPLFTAPAGCTAIQTAPNTEGVQCYGDTGFVRSATPELSFSGGGTGLSNGTSSSLAAVATSSRCSRSSTASRPSPPTA